MKRKITHLLMMLVVFVFANSSVAELKLAGIFSDGMVLQQKMKVPVWGKAAPGTEVTVVLGDQTKKTKAGKSEDSRNDSRRCCFTIKSSPCKALGGAQ